ncbi:creatininase family protein [Natronorubrum sp. JWXQ-INN-674]|uniref:Creatininase family protein n=1 Tax=Natronorubrum halalkaliphilum TaxID=2691917 RepID=A0A6B0VHU9_9EURY|nr:creatininase family protein [Natronorubrum halalkaliphilum]MXV60526.1 creatininase family protein [Natronorubrum halalkaliphilum]
MADPADTYWLENLTWEETENALQTADMAVLPCGSTEQHSTHLPLSVDSIRAENLTNEILERAAEYDLELLGLPTLSYGYSEHHIDFPGTLTFSYETYIQMIVELGRCVAHHGMSNLLIVNCHGGNKEPHKLAIDRLQREYDLNVFYVHWTDFAREQLEERFGTEWGHAGEYETSQIEHYCPEQVRDGKKTPQTRREEFEAHPFSYFHEITKEGGLGDPTESDPEFMEQLIDETTDAILEAISADLPSLTVNPAPGNQ